MKRSPLHGSNGRAGTVLVALGTLRLTLLHRVLEIDPVAPGNTKQIGRAPFDSPTGDAGPLKTDEVDAVESGVNAVMA